MTMPFDTITTSATFASIFLSALPNGGETGVESVVTTVRAVTVPKTNGPVSEATSTFRVTSESTSESTSTSRVTPESTSESTSTSRVTSQSIPRVTASIIASDPSDRTSPVLATSSPTVPIASSPNTTRPTSNHSIAPGAAAGIGVGSAAAGALIAALIVWFIMRKARKSPKIPNDDPGGSWLSSNTA